MKALFVKIVWLYSGVLSSPGQVVESPDPFDELAHSSLVVRYYESKIFPVIITARQSFDNELSEDEKNTIREAQVYLKHLMEKEQVELQSDKLITRSLVDQLRSILNGHKKSLDEIQGQLAPECKQWKADIQEIVTSSVPGKSPSYTTALSPVHFLLLNSTDLLRAYFIGQ
ncbi:hypothetical protein GCM10009122_14760 [Fulvivirga kasyanovii]|uniref:Uncharacterized protein n=1 Tax=Fulvivirga kasyanovii TaxID=396812 RepID=A0ABW9RRH1_9BACT|nr:hypothetical protein [Fulvivirga kasyanovii]MTI26526.1 hypothetical protein [Fulvivirga kasyanovii]